MPMICYREKTFTAEHEKLIATANGICADYEAQGFKLTLRQLYYQFVARAIIPNTMQSYKRLGSIINDARLAGCIDWDAIEDRTRNLESPNTWDSPKQILETCARQFKFDVWADQETRVEVWIEKEALVGVIEPICSKLRVPYFACRGYTSQSEAWGAGQRFADYNARGQSVVVLHLGDHDPSGIDMTRDNGDRLKLFSNDGDVRIRRLALNFDQIKQYNPPPNPAKLTDSRAEGYIAKHGRSSWELDALEPSVIAEMIADNVDIYVDEDKWQASFDREVEAQTRIMKMAKAWKD
jgi:hypothetical protein